MTDRSAEGDHVRRPDTLSGMTRGIRAVLAVLVGFGVAVGAGQLMDNAGAAWLLGIIAGLVVWLATIPLAARVSASKE